MVIVFGVRDYKQETTTSTTVFNTLKYMLKKLQNRCHYLIENVAQSSTISSWQK